MRADRVALKIRIATNVSSFAPSKKSDGCHAPNAAHTERKLRGPRQHNWQHGFCHADNTGAAGNMIGVLMLKRLASYVVYQGPVRHRTRASVVAISPDWSGLVSRSPTLATSTSFVTPA